MSREHLFTQLGLRDVEAVKAGEIAMEMDLRPNLINPRGGLQGGLIATLIDIVGGRAAVIGLPNDRSVATADLSVHYLSAVTVGPAKVESTTLRRGKNLVVVHVEVTDAGRSVLAAVGTVSFAVVTFRAGQADPGRPRDASAIPV